MMLFLPKVNWGFHNPLRQGTEKVEDVGQMSTILHSLYLPKSSESKLKVSEGGGGQKSFKTCLSTLFMEGLITI